MIALVTSVDSLLDAFIGVKRFYIGIIGITYAMFGSMLGFVNFIGVWRRFDVGSHVRVLRP